VTVTVEAQLALLTAGLAVLLTAEGWRAATAPRRAAAAG
jgi:hypothetical protein